MVNALIGALLALVNVVIYVLLFTFLGSGLR